MRTPLALAALALTLAACSGSRPTTDAAGPDTAAAEARVAGFGARAAAVRGSLGDRPASGARGFGADDTITGEIADGDARMDGQPFDAYAVELATGDRLTADLRSDDFETFLVVLPPTGPEVYNDYPGMAEDDYHYARVATTAEEDGLYLLLAMPLNDGDMGAYTLDVSAPGDVFPVPPEMLTE